MILTFFVPLVFFFITSVEASEVMEAPKVVECSAGPRTVRVTSYHPVLRSNVAIARLMALER